MLMRITASWFLFLFIGPFRYVGCVETKERDVSVLQVNELQDVIYIAKNDALELNCSVNGTIQEGYLKHLAWKHNSTLIQGNFTRTVINNTTLQLKKNHTQFGDAGVYVCGVFTNSSKIPNITLRHVRVIVGVKPTEISRELITLLDVYGLLVPKTLTLQWPALEVNVTYELVVTTHSHYWSCMFDHSTHYKLKPKYRNELLSCQVGVDVLNDTSHRCSLRPPDPFTRCDIFCAKVIARNHFGTSETKLAKHWNLRQHAKCPPLENVNVSMGDSFTLSWDHPRLVDVDMAYHITFSITQRLTKQVIRDVTKVVHNSISFKYKAVPFARYIFKITCSSTYDIESEGPPVYAEATSKEAVPSEAPLGCQANNRSKNGVFITWKVPPMNTWNGKPRAFKVSYGNTLGNTTKVVNTSLDELRALFNGSATLGTMLENLAPDKNYTAKVAFCTAVGCKWASNEWCIINSLVEENISKKGTIGPDQTNATSKDKILRSIAIVCGLVGGLSLVLVVIAYVKRKRIHQMGDGSLWKVLGPLNFNHNYEDMPNDVQSSSDGSEQYDYITTTTPPSNHALKDIDCTIGNLPVTKL